MATWIIKYAALPARATGAIAEGKMELGMPSFGALQQACLPLAGPGAAGHGPNPKLCQYFAACEYGAQKASPAA